MARGVKFPITAEDKTAAAFRAVRGNLDSVTRSLGAVKAAVAGIVAGAAINALRRGIENAITYADEIAKTSNAIGLTTDALQEYRYAADLTGVGQETFNSSMVAFVKRMGELRAETGPLVSFLNKWDEGLKDALASTNSQEEALQLLFGEMAGMENATNRAALANAAFSRSGVRMVNFVRDGTDALADMREEAHELGLVLNARLLRASEEMSDQLTVMDRIISVNLHRALLGLAPLITGIAQGIAESAPQIERFADSFLKIVGADALRSLQGLREEREKVLHELNENLMDPGRTTLFRDEHLDNYKERLSELNVLIEDAGKREAAVRAMLNNPLKPETGTGGTSDAEKARDALRGMRMESEQALDSARQLERVLNEGYDLEQINEFVERQQQAGKIWRDMISAREKLAGLSEGERERAIAELANQAAETADLNQMFERELEIRQKLAAAEREMGAVAEVNAAIRRGASSEEIASLRGKLEIEKELAELRDQGFGEDQLTRLGDTMEAQRRLVEESDRLNESLREQERIAGQVDQAFAAAFSSFVSGTSSAEDALRGLLNSLLQLASNQAFQQIFGSASGGGGLFNTLFKGLFGAGGSGASASGGGGLSFGAGGLDFTSSLAGARADGGPVGAGRSYLVGERGPEIFTPRSTGHITPNGAMGARPINVDFQVVNNVPGAEVSQRREQGPDGGELIIAEVNRAATQGRLTGVQSRYALQPQVRRR